MSKMTVIQLLNKIANGEEVPTIIKYKHNIWTYRNDVKDYTDETQFFFGEYIFQEDTQKELNYEVEIIEEDKKIEKIGIIRYSESPVDAILHKKIDEIIDYINKEK